MFPDRRLWAQNDTSIASPALTIQKYLLMTSVPYHHHLKKKLQGIQAKIDELLNWGQMLQINSAQTKAEC